jgi:hypothetical protein
MPTEADGFYDRMLLALRGEHEFPRSSLGERWTKAAAAAIAKDATLLDPARKDDLLRASGCDLEGAPGPDMRGVPQKFIFIGDNDDSNDLELAIRARIREAREKTK